MAASLLPWNAPGWRSEVAAWLSSQVQAAGGQLVGEAGEPRIRPWSVVIPVPTSMGLMYFKVSAPALRHEAAVTQTLAELFPDVVPHVYACQAPQGWLLMEAGNRLLREALADQPDLRRWDSCLRRYGALQVDLAGRANELIDLGVPDRRLAALPALLETMLEDPTLMPGDGEATLTAGERDWLRAFLPRMATMVRELAAFHVPDSLDHGDFHDGNIFVRDEGYLFFDWGDCGVTHPFISMRTVLVSLENTLGLLEDSAPARALAAAYLDTWRAQLGRPALEEALELSLRLSPIVAAHRWQLALQASSPEDSQRFSAAVPSLLRELIERNRSD